MKDFISKFLVFFILVSFSSCDFLAYSEDEKEKTESPEVNPEITISSDNVVISQDGGTSLISFTCNSTWMASSGSSWMSISQANGFAGSITLVVTAKANDSYDERNGVITISSGSISKNITVTQKQKNALLVSSDKFEVSAEGGNISVDVKSNVEYAFKIEDSAESWISAASTRALSSDSFIFSVAENNSTDLRKGNIIFTDGNLEEVVTVYQQGISASLILSSKEYEVDYKGDTLTVEIQSNSTYSLEMPVDDWIKAISTRSLTTYTQKFVVDVNRSKEMRSCVIVFVNDETGASETVTIKQLPMPSTAFLIDKNELNCSVVGGKVDLHIQTISDFSVEVTKGKDWLYQIESSDPNTLSFNVDLNYSIFARYGEITITLTETEETIVIPVCQNVEPVIFVSEDEINLDANRQEISIDVLTNDTYSIETSSWIKCLSTRAVLNTHQLSFEISENAADEVRTGQIYLIGTTETRTINVIQAAKK